MKISMRLKYMWNVFVDILAAIGAFLLSVGTPVVAIIGFIVLMSYIPLWVSILITAGLFLIGYVWIRAEMDYRKDYEASKNLLNVKYREITKIWSNMMSEGKSCRTIYNLMTTMIDDYDTLLDYHKTMYGEDETYKLYCNRIDEFIKSCENNEKMEQQRQEERAAQLKKMNGNAVVEEMSSV